MANEQEVLDDEDARATFKNDCLDAINNNDVTGLNALIENKGTGFLYDPAYFPEYADNYSFLHHIVVSGKAEMFQAMLDKIPPDQGLLPEAVYGGTLLQEAAKKEDVRFLTALWSKMPEKAELNPAGDNNYTPLHVASAKGNIAVVNAIFEKTANNTEAYNCKNIFGQTPLLLAVQNKKMDVVQALLNKGVDVNAADNRGRTPLHVAVEVGDLDIVEKLLPTLATPGN